MFCGIYETPVSICSQRQNDLGFPSCTLDEGSVNFRVTLERDFRRRPVGNLRRKLRFCKSSNDLGEISGEGQSEICVGKLRQLISGVK
ncbi:hypothetical protein CEXT_568931 [Caerostris extrusa]|uniref:Uncharacterized protein n=1 Tax=Caerostris extrusa TaxID=172846 RepID=A0AAV4RQ59_CAEEX|nr:hypothetical protein CEXT_568931 [Caerostris extrusa]